MASKQRHLVTEAKFLLRRKEKELADLKREMYWLEQFIMTNEYVVSVRKTNFSKNWIKNQAFGNKHRKNMLKAALGDVRDN